VREKMSEQFEPSLEDVLEEINKVAERMKKAKMTSDKAGYEIALKEYERFNEKYSIYYTGKEILLTSMQDVINYMN